MCDSQQLSASLYIWLCLNIAFDTLNVTVVFDSRNVRSSSFRHYESLIITKWGCQRLWMSLWYIKSSNHSHSLSTFLSGLHCPIKKIWGLETAGMRGEGGGIQYKWEKEHIGTSYCVQFVSCRFLPVKSDDINEKMKLRADAQHCLNVRNAVCVCVWERWWLVGASWLWTVFQTDPQLQGFSDAAHILISSLCRQACCSSFQILLHCLSEPIKRSTQGGCRYSRDLTW